MRSYAARPTTGLLLAVLLGSVACESDHLTGPPAPNFATAAAAWEYVWFTGGTDHSCLARAPASGGIHTLLCWGNNNVGQLGLGSFGADRLIPTAVPNNTGSILAAGDGGNAHHCALSNGRAYCWGWNPHGQLGDGTTTNRSVPTLVLGGITWSQIATGTYHTCAVNNIGVAYCWGRGADGALGNGTTDPRLVPTPVSTAVAFWAVQAGSNFTCGRSRAFPATIYCWGNNGYGQLGIGSFTNLLKPGAAVVGGAKWNDLQVGAYHVCANTYLNLTPPNYCWGFNFYGQLGNGQTTPRNQPHAVSTSVRLNPIVAGYAHSCGIRVDNSQMLCWGRGAEGQLGNGFFVDRLTPYPVYGGITFIANSQRVAAGERHVIAQRNDGSVMAWGRNNHGQLGDGTTNTRPTPVVILPP
jgi:alpha-tubulin suppressor-like RCC1 family protein